jgi:hypothetical protein
MNYQAYHGRFEVSRNGKLGDNDPESAPILPLNHDGSSY